VSSVRELEAKNAVERKKLIQAIYQYLSQLKIGARIIQEPSLDSLGTNIFESAIQLTEQRIDSVRLFRMSNPNCGDTGEALRFQFKLKLLNELPAESMSRLNAHIKPMKEGKILGLFGGKIVGIKWTGQELANSLNQETEISEGLLRCARIWGGLEMDIEAVSSSEIHISGPWFSNPGTITALFSPGKSYEEQDCIFGFKTIDRIAKLIRDMAENNHS
jgi:hypothetical protein